MPPLPGSTCAGVPYGTSTGGTGWIVIPVNDPMPISLVAEHRAAGR